MLTTQQLVDELEKVIQSAGKGANRTRARMQLSSLKTTAAFGKVPIFRKANWNDFKALLAKLHQFLTKKIGATLPDDVQEAVEHYLQLKTPPQK